MPNVYIMSSLHAGNMCSSVMFVNIFLKPLAILEYRLRLVRVLLMFAFCCFPGWLKNKRWEM